MSVAAPEKDNTLTLNATDRCDRCGAQAYLVAMKNSAELLFCSHHGTKHLTGLLESGFSIHDERSALTS